jgi:CHAT domain-containing protein
MRRYSEYSLLVSRFLGICGIGSICAWLYAQSDSTLPARPSDAPAATSTESQSPPNKSAKDTGEHAPEQNEGQRKAKPLLPSLLLQIGIAPGQIKATQLSTQAAILAQKGRHREALPLAQEAAKIQQSIVGKQHPDYAASLNNLADLYTAMGEFSKSEPLLLQARDICKKTLGEQHPTYAGSLNNLAELYRLMGDYSKSESLYLQASDIWRKSLGEQDPDYALSLNNLAVLYNSKGEYSKSEPLLLQARDIRKKVLGEQHSDYAVSLNNLAELYRSMGNYLKAEPLYFQARDICKKVKGERSPEYAACLNNLATLYYSMGDYSQAEPLYLQILDIHRQLKGEQSSLYALSLNNLAGLYESMGEYVKAEPLHLQARDVSRKVLGEQHTDYALSLHSLAALYYLMGEYTKAEPLYLQTLAIWKRVLGEKHPNYATNLNNLALLYRSMGEYSKAELFYLQARDIRKKVLGEQHPDYALSLNNLAGLYNLLGDYSKAEPLILEARDIRKEVLGEQHPAYATSLNTLAGLYCSMGEYTKAELYYLQALDIRKKVLGERHPDYALSLNNLAGLYRSMGDLTKAEPFMLQARDIYRMALGEQHPNYAGALSSLALLYYSMEEYEKAASFYEEAAKIECDLAVTIVAAVSEAQALNYAAKELGPPNMLISVWRHTTRPDDDLYAYVWLRRGLIQQIIAKRQHRLQEMANADVRQRYGHYQDTRRSLARLILAPADSNSKRLAAKRKRIEELNEEKERLERQLAAELPAFRRQLQSERRPHTDLTAHLPANTVFVDLLHYSYFEQDPKVRGKAGKHRTDTYAAFLVRPGASTVRVDLGPAAPINVAIARWHDDIAGGSESSAVQELRRLVWEPIENQLPPGTKTAYLCPDDKLTAIPWVALPGRKVGTVLLDDYSLALVPNGQFLLEQLTSTRGSADQKGELLVVGGVSYDNKPAEVGPRQEMLATLRDAAIGDKHITWPPLPGSKRELEAVTGLAGARTVAKLDGVSAGTTAVLTKLPEARWAHFATHGFLADMEFRSALQVDEKAFEQGQALSGSERRTVAGRNPLVLSGLVLAGANLPREKDPYGIAQGDGGILTAEAIAGLRLDKLELAVLSACDTGLGDVAGGEGVFGLQRAFHSAGAQNVVASLWKVDDKATAALMRLFYQNLWTEKMLPLEALRQAQLRIYHHPELIDSLATARGPVFEQPMPLPDGGRKKPASATAPTRQWAAFILSGAGR